MISLLPPGSTWIGIDRDSENLDRAQARLMRVLEDKQIIFHFIHESFDALESICQKLSLETIDFILYDL
jgi:16S rRNA C1402 N4-methylase RsmH